MNAERQAVEQTVDALSRMIRAHAGGLQLVDLSADGVVTVKYTGMCTGCQYRPVTTAGSVRPALLAVAGVTEVVVLGTRISAEAEARLADSLAPYAVQTRVTRIVQRAAEEYS
jgi:Fe-S cluster biogenesis protein NfuA